MKTLTTSDLMFLLSGMQIKADCGHTVTIGSMDRLVIVSVGGKTIKTYCGKCYR